MLSKEQIKHIANLARLELTAAEEIKYGKQLSAVLNYVDKLAEVDTNNFLSTSSTSGLVNVWREDEVRAWDELEVKEALAQGETVSNQVKVKRVL